MLGVYAAIRAALPGPFLLLLRMGGLAAASSSASLRKTLLLLSQHNAHPAAGESRASRCLFPFPNSRAGSLHAVAALFPVALVAGCCRSTAPHEPASHVSLRARLPASPASRTRRRNGIPFCGTWVRAGGARCEGELFPVFTTRLETGRRRLRRADVTHARSPLPCALFLIRPHSCSRDWRTRHGCATAGLATAGHSPRWRGTHPRPAASSADNKTVRGFRGHDPGPASLFLRRSLRHSCRRIRTRSRGRTVGPTHARRDGPRSGRLGPALPGFMLGRSSPNSFRQGVSARHRAGPPRPPATSRCPDLGAFLIDRYDLDPRHARGRDARGRLAGGPTWGVYVGRSRAADFIGHSACCSPKPLRRGRARPRMTTTRGN